MAVETLFAASTSSLKAALRLSGAAQADSLVIIDQAIQEVRIGFYESLGQARVAEIRTATLVDNPSDSTQIARAKAAQTEIMWVRLLLLRRLPSLFVDGGGNASQVWNEEAMLRPYGKSDQEREIERLLAEVQNNVASLASGGVTEQPQVQVAVIGPASGTVDYMGSSVFPGIQRY